MPFDESKRNGNGTAHAPDVSLVTRDLSPPPTDDLEDFDEEVLKKASRFWRAQRLREPGRAVKSR